LPTGLFGVALISFNRRAEESIVLVPMRISDVACPSCPASYEVAESISAKGNPGQARCAVCGDLLASWQEPKLRAYRLVLPPEHKYPRIPVPPSPMSSRSPD
jgi:hypothetical protein